MRKLSKILLWILMLYYGGLFLILVLLSWGPIYLAITDGVNWKFDWSVMLLELLIRALGFILSFIIYIYLVKINKNIDKKIISIFFISLLLYITLIIINPINLSVILINILPFSIIISIILSYKNQLFKQK